MNRPSGPRKTRKPIRVNPLAAQHVCVCRKRDGRGVLALANPVEAKVIYTPANVRIVPNAGLVRIDLNHDGIADFGLSNPRKILSSVRFAGLEVKRLRPANEI
jgi:hypothetical protein